MANVLKGNLEVIGAAYDDVEERFNAFLNTEMWADTTSALLSSYEKAYGLASDGSDSTRRARIITAIRTTGGLTKQYIEDRCNELANGLYTVVIVEGTQTIGFIVGDLPRPIGEATRLPATLGDPGQQGALWTFTVEVTGAPFSPQPELEALVKKLKPAWTKAFFDYL